MHVLTTCKNEEDLIKNEGSRVVTTLYIDFKDAQGHSLVSCRIWPKFKLIQALMIVLVTCKTGDDPIKNEGARGFITFLPL